MNLEPFRPYLLPAAVVAFLAWRFYSFHAVKRRLPELLKQGAVIVDVRSPGEFAAGAGKNSVNIPLSELTGKVSTWDRGRIIVVCCASGTRSAMAVGLLKGMGFKTVINAGPWTNTVL